MTHREPFTLRALYLYSVCLITLLVSLFSLAEIIRSSVELAYPDPYNAPWEGCADKGPDAECAERDALDTQRAANSQKRWAVLNLVGAATTAAMAAPVYLYHWRRIQKDRSEVMGTRQDDPADASA